MCKILQLSQIAQLQEKRIDDDPAEGAHQDDGHPYEAHGDMVAEDHVVDDGGKDDGKGAPGEEEAGREEPWDHVLLVLLAESPEKDAGCDEKGESGQSREQGEDDEAVAHVRVSHVHKLKAHDVKTVVGDSWFGHS